MSELDKLLRELCPDGVEYKKLGEIATISRGGNFQKKDFLTEGVPCIHYGQIYTKYGLFTDKTFTFISEECAKKQKRAQPNDIVMAVTSENIEDVCKCLAWLGDEPVAVSGHSAIIHHDQNAKYLVYYFHSQMFFAQKRKLAHGTKVIEVTPDALVDITLPIPPAEIQCEIVRILDNFTNLTAELTAELTARKMQYSYYRDNLLSFNMPVSKKKIGEITRVFSAARVHKNEWMQEGVPFYRSSDVISKFNGVENSRGKAYISFDLYKRLSAKSGKIMKDDILITGGGTIGIPYVVPSDEPIYVKDADLLCIQKSKEFNSRFLYHYFLSTEFRKYLENITHNATIAHYTISQIENTPVPLPPLDVQNRIVNVLDNFEKICSDLNIGLPAEIEARQKQYEYYRDKLLTFAETGNTILSRAEQSRAEQSRAEQSRAEQSRAEH